MFEKTYEEMNDKLEPGQPLIRDTLYKMESARKAAPSRPRRFRRPLVFALSAALILTLSATVLAASMPSFRELLFGGSKEAPLNPAGSQLTEIQNVTAEQDGFRLEILGAARNSESLAVYFTLTDTSGKNRLDEKTVVNPVTRQFLSLQGEKANKQENSGSFYTCDTLEFDPASNTIFCRYVLDSQNAPELDLSEITLFIPSLTLGFERREYLPISIDESDFTTETMELNHEQILKPRDTEIPLEGTEQAAISAIGYVDGRLRIQLKYKRTGEYFSADVRFVDKVIAPEELEHGYQSDFERREAEAWLARHGTQGMDETQQVHVVNNGSIFFNMEDGAPVSTDAFSGQYSYVESIYDIPPDDLSNFGAYLSWLGYRQELQCVSQDSDDGHTGVFRATFQIDDRSDVTPKTLTDISVGDGKIDSLTLNGLGLTIRANRRLAESLEITADCGESRISFSRTILTGLPPMDSLVAIDDFDGTVTVKYLADRPFHLEEISSFTINGTEVPIR